MATLPTLILTTYLELIEGGQEYKPPDPPTDDAPRFFAVVQRPITLAEFIRLVAIEVNKQNEQQSKT